MNSARPEPQDSARSPFAGCAILIAALLVMVFLIGFSTWTLFRQFNEIAKFTAEKPVALEVTPTEGREAALNQLAERFEAFRQQLGTENPASLALTPEEMNLAIAACEPFKELRGTFRILAVDGEALRIAISFPLNGKPRLAREGEGGWVASDTRYLNGTLVARPVLLKREVVLSIDRLEVPGATVPKEFIEQMSPYRITERYLTDKTIAPVMAALTRVDVRDGAVVLTRTPGVAPVDAISDKQVDAAGSRFFTVLGIAASLFLLFAGTVVFIALRAKQRQG